MRPGESPSPGRRPMRSKSEKQRINATRIRASSPQAFLSTSCLHSYEDDHRPPADFWSVSERAKLTSTSALQNGGHKRPHRSIIVVQREEPSPTAAVKQMARVLCKGAKSQLRLPKNVLQKWVASRKLHLPKEFYAPMQLAILCKISERRGKARKARPMMRTPRSNQFGVQRTHRQPRVCAVPTTKFGVLASAHLTHAGSNAPM